MTDIKPKRSPPPPPERRLSGAGTGTIYSRPKASNKAPDWDFWRAMRKVKEWQACALSLNIDPDSLKPHPQGWMAGPGNGPIFVSESFPSSDVERRFEKRRRILRSNRWEREIFTLPMQPHSCLAPDDVLLSEFSAFGVSISWDEMPPELVAIAKPPLAPTEAQAALAIPMDRKLSQAAKTTVDDGEAPPDELIPFKQACEFLHTRLGSTGPELAMWIFQGDISAWRRDGRMFHFDNTERKSSAEMAAQLLMEMKVRLSRSAVDSFQPNERYLEYSDVLTKIHAKFTDSYSTVVEDALMRFHQEIAIKVGRDGEPVFTPIGRRPMVAAVVPGGGYAADIKDGLFHQSEIEKFIAERDLVFQRRTAPAQSETGLGKAAESIPKAATCSIEKEHCERTANTWDEYNLRRLWDESKEPGMTHQKLAEKHGVTRQRIGTLLGKAKGQFGPRKADPFASFRPGNRKK